MDVAITVFVGSLAVVGVSLVVGLVTFVHTFWSGGGAERWLAVFVMAIAAALVSGIVMGIMESNQVTQGHQRIEIEDPK